MRKLLLLQILLTTLLLMPLLSFAQSEPRGTTTITAPGVRVERHNGWFGTHQTVYQDALGNGYSAKKGLFPWSRRESASVMGTSVSSGFHHTEVTGPDGHVLVERRKSLFGRQDTTINGDGLYQRFRSIFNNNSSTPPTQPRP